MANYTVSPEQIAEGSTVLVRGKLAFSRLTRLIDGEELAKSDQRKISNGMSPVERPHTTATVTHAEVQFADPNSPTKEETFVSERRYTSKKYPETGPNYSIDSKGSNLPIIAVPSADGDDTYEQDTSGRELAPGLDVTVVLRIYKPKTYAKRGLAIEQVVVHEPVRYYSGGAAGTEELAARGIIFKTQPQAVRASEATPAGEAPDTSEGEQTLPAPQPSAAPTPAPAPAPVQSEAANQASVATPPAQNAPNAETETMEQKIKRLEAENAQKNAGSAVGEPANPWNEGEQAQQAGITYPG